MNRLSVHLRGLVHVRPALGDASGLLPRQAGQSVEFSVARVRAVRQYMRDLTDDVALCAR